MSNYLAVAAVTATLRRMLQAVVAADVSGATVTTVRPSGTGAGLPQTGVNAVLYQVLPNPDLRNADLPTRRADGSVVDRPTAALDLHYLLSFYGDEGTLEPQRLLGSVVRTLHARPILSRQLIRETLADPAFAFLASSDLADQIEVVRLTPLNFSLAELSQLWTGPLQKADYVLSVAYGASFVLLTADEKPTAALPVKDRRIFVTPGRPPLLAALAAAGDDPAAPITLGTTLRLTGERLRAEATQVRLSGQLFTPPSVTDTEIRFPLDGSTLDVSALRAGTQTVQVVQPPVPPPSNEIVQPPVPAPVLPPAGVESNVTTFLLRPRIVSAALANAVTAPDGTVSGSVVLKIEPPLGAHQSALLLLNPAPGASAAVESALPVPARPADSAEVHVPAARIAAGRYLVRLQVDGAESPLTADTDPASPTFHQWNGPLLTFGSGHP